MMLHIAGDGSLPVLNFKLVGCQTYCLFLNKHPLTAFHFQMGWEFST